MLVAHDATHKEFCANVLLLLLDKEKREMDCSD